MRSLSYLLLATSVIIIAGCSTPPAKSQYSCPDWSSNPVSNHGDKDFSNLGCAQYNNIAAQVANPADLQSGHGEATSSSERDSTILQKYMSNTQEPLPSVSSSTQSANSR